MKIEIHEFEEFSKSVRNLLVAKVHSKELNFEIEQLNNPLLSTININGEDKYGFLNQTVLEALDEKTLSEIEVLWLQSFI